MEKEKQKKIVSRVIVFAIALTMLIPVSAVLASAPGPGSTVIYVEYKDSATLQTMIDNGAELLVDYESGFALLKVPVGMSKALREAGVYVNPLNDRNLLSFDSGVSFDLSHGTPDIPMAFQKTYSHDEVGTYIVKCVGPMRGEWTQELKDMGVSVEHNIVKYSYVVHMDGALKDKVSSLSFVDWIGVYEPYYKVPTKALSEDTAYLTAILCKGASMDAVENDFVQAGATIISVDNGEVTKSIDFSVSQSDLPKIAALESVYMMYPYSVPQPMDLVADDIHGAKQLWDPIRSGLPVAIDGSTQVVGIQDTGFDRGNQDPPGICDMFNPTDRIIRYKDQSGNSDPDGNGGVAHGTHCIGLIGANGYLWERHDGTDGTDGTYLGEGTGMAPKVRISADGILAAQGGLSPKTSYWDTERGDGATALSNSWGSDPADYGGHASDADDQTHSYPNVLVVFAAGNAGPDNDTLGPDSQGKNGFCVAAGENYRPDQIDSDNPNLIVDFSSRGGTFSDTRIKPDIVGVGTSDISLMGYAEFNASNGGNGNPQPDYIMDVDEYNSGSDTVPPCSPDNINDYRYMQGTSMACPNVAGGIALVKDYYNKTEGINSSSAVLTKATIINGAHRMDPDIYSYPGYDQGWGRMDLKQSLYPDVPTTWQHAEHNFSSYDTWVVSNELNTNIVKGDVPLKITLTWIDTSGKDLSNDLNLNVTSPSGVWYNGNAYDTDGWTVPNATVNETSDTHIGTWDNGSGYDNVNNVERVEIQTPETGVWTIRVLVGNQPETFPAAVVISGDFGPQKDYQVDLSSDYPTIFHVVAGGHTTFPFQVLNFGKNYDNISMSTSGMPSDLSVSFDRSLFALASTEEADGVATFSASSSISIGVYSFMLKATSQDDPSSTPATDILDIKIEVLASPLPHTFMITNGSVDEMSPSVLTFNDGSTNWIFIAYRKTTTNGVNVWEAHTTLDSNGEPVEPWTYNEVSGLNDIPNDIRMGYITGGTNQSRVFMTWTGYDPSQSDQSAASWARFAYADPSEYNASSTTWHLVTIDINSGSDNYNYKRVSFCVFRNTGGSGQLVYVFEHLDFKDASTITGIHTDSLNSTDGGLTWGGDTQVDPGGDYYFFPNGCVDQNQTVWLFYYHRASSGNDRDLACMVYDGAWGGDSGGDTKSTDVYDSDDNIMWPATVSTNEGNASNRVYVTITRDGSGTMKLYAGYYDGNVSSDNPPADTSDIWGTAIGPLGPPDSSVSDANYNRRPVLNIAAVDNYTWIPYMENTNPYGVPNMWTVYSNDTFSNFSVTKVTADAYAKGHQMSDTLTIGNHRNMYEVYHSSHGTITEVNYDVYLVIYHEGWENDPDTVGPATSQVAASPNPFNLTVDSTFNLTANIDDAEMSGIAAAQYIVSDTEPTDWSGATAMDLSGHSASEVATATVTPPSSWQAGEVHTVWVRGQDNATNWGDPASVDVEVVGSPPEFNISVHKGWNLISFCLGARGDIERVLNDSNVVWDYAEWYDPLDTGDHWKTHVVGRGLNDLNSINNTMGIWLHVTDAGDGNLTVRGDAPDSTVIQLHPGWNLLSYPASASAAMNAANLPDDVTKIAEYDSTTTYLVSVVTDWSANNFVPGNAYWVYSTAETTWTVTY